MAALAAPFLENLNHSYIHCNYEQLELCEVGTEVAVNKQDEKDDDDDDEDEDDKDEVDTDEVV